jgi:hypothetical protein
VGPGCCLWAVCTYCGSIWMECGPTALSICIHCGLKPDMFVVPHHSYCGPLQVSCWADESSLLVAACEQERAGLQTRAFVGQRFVRIRLPTGQHSVQMGQHSCANSLQTGSWTNTPCEEDKYRKIKPQHASACSRPAVSKLNERLHR